MVPRPDQDDSRRQFLRSATRGVVACGLTAVTAGLIAKHGWPELTCINSGLCADCSVLRSCKLPAARPYNQPTEERL